MQPDLLVAWICAIVVGLIGIALVFLIFTGKIDLKHLLAESSDPEHKASLAKLQFLIFTFVIALSLFAITINKGEFPKDIHPNILVLLGISAGSSLVATGIAAAERTRLAETRADVRKTHPDAAVADL